MDDASYKSKLHFKWAPGFSNFSAVLFMVLKSRLYSLSG